MLEFTWEKYQAVFNMLFLGIDEDDLIKEPAEKVLDQMNKEIRKRTKKGSFPPSASLFNKRDYLIPHTFAMNLSTEARLLYNGFLKVRDVYFSGGYGKAFSMVTNMHARIFAIPNPEERFFILLLLADLYYMMSVRIEASYICLDCISSTDLPRQSQTRGAAFSMLGDIAYGKRQYGRALLEYQRAVEIWQESSSAAGQIITRLDVGRTLFYLERYSDALSTVAEARELSSKAENKVLELLCLLSEVEIHSLLRDSDSAKASFDEYRKRITSDSPLCDSQWEKLVLAKYFTERSRFKEGLLEVLHACLNLRKYEKHEHTPDAMVMLAALLNDEGAYEDSISCLVECYNLYPELKSYRFALFLQWLLMMEVALRGSENSKLADELSSVAVRILSYSINEVSNSILARSGEWQNFATVESVVDKVRELMPKYFSRHGLRIDLNKDRKSVV